jgi:hypothetical protein
MTKVRLYDIANSTTLESNKSHTTNRHAPRFGNSLSGRVRAHWLRSKTSAVR